MPRSFESSVEFPDSVDQIFSTFCDETYWEARIIATGNPNAKLDSLIIDPGETVTANVSVSFLGEKLPKAITKFSGGELKFSQTQRWVRIDGDRVQGEIDVAVSRVPASGAGKALLVPVANGARLDVTTIVEVKIPLVGGKFERYVGGLLDDDLKSFQRFTTEWIAEKS
ncbi:hypothetical protein A5707_12565 [Mycobacterium kyorinense]|uniref:DUF2505 domain-containing protein n=1 Tax=Mycobacterium kyorinense TaxID=487514 RepID=A0A1A2ZT17_9MYCO|nr:DUF2505 domain-containing protein [Mycobacterium kyorinense]OBI52226.1 hypothetical protein A5707_12565 [Mycobacterium kyorinense]